jgi:hypothetical protein
MYPATNLAGPSNTTANASNSPLNNLEPPEFPQDTAGVVEAFKKAGKMSFYKEGGRKDEPNWKVYCYRTVVRVFKVQPWEIVEDENNPLKFSRPIMEALDRLAKALENDEHPLGTAKILLDKQCEDRAKYTSSPHRLQRQDIDEAVKEHRQTESLKQEEDFIQM